MIYLTACLLCVTSLVWLRSRPRRVPVDRG